MKKISVSIQNNNNFNERININRDKKNYENEKWNDKTMKQQMAKDSEGTQYAIWVSIVTKMRYQVSESDKVVTEKIYASSSEERHSDCSRGLTHFWGFLVCLVFRENPVLSYAWENRQ